MVSLELPGFSSRKPGYLTLEVMQESGNLMLEFNFYRTSVWLSTVFAFCVPNNDCLLAAAFCVTCCLDLEMFKVASCVLVFLP